MPRVKRVPSLYESIMEARAIARAEIMARVAADTRLVMGSLRDVAENGEGPNGTGKVPACRTLLETFGILGQGSMPAIAVETQDKDGNRTRLIVAPGKSEDQG